MIMITRNFILKNFPSLRNYNWKKILALLIVVSIFFHCLLVTFDFPYPVIQKLAKKASFSVFFLSSFVLVILLSYKKISTWLDVSANPELMVITRKAYAVLCLFSAFQHFSLIKYGLEPYNLLLLGWQVPSTESFLLSFLYILSLIMLLVGYKIRLAWILIFLTGGLIIPFSLEIFLKNIFNFYAIFISVDLWKGKKTNEGSWAIVLMCLSACVLMTAAGLHKLLDPVWQEGMGFYYSLNIAFFPDRYLWGVLDHERLVYFFNWSTIIVELIALPLFLFKRFWPFVIVCFVGLGLFLTFAMSGIGIMGGPIVFCMILLFLSLTSIPKTLSKYYFWKKYRTDSIINEKKKYSLNSINLGMFIFWLTVLSGFHNFYKDFKSNLFFYPSVFGNFKNTQSPILSFENAIITKVDFIDSNFIEPLQPHKFWQFTWSIALFDYHHLFDRLYFKVIFTDNENKETEPTNYFDEDGAISENHPLIGNEKFILSCFRMMDAVRSEPYISHSILGAPMENELKGIISYSLENSELSQYKSATIYVKPMYQPFKYSGNYKPWGQNKWIAFYYYEINEKKGKIINRPKTYQYDKLEIDAFKQKTIVPNF